MKFVNKVIAGMALGGVAFGGALLSGAALGTAALLSAPTVASADVSVPKHKFDDHKRDLNFTYAYPKQVGVDETTTFVQICEDPEASPNVEIVGTGILIPQGPGTFTTVDDLEKKKKFDHEFDHDKKFKHEEGDWFDGKKPIHHKKFDRKKDEHLWAYFGFAEDDLLNLAPGTYKLKGSCGGIGKLIVPGLLNGIPNNNIVNNNANNNANDNANDNANNQVG